MSKSVRKFKENRAYSEYTNDNATSECPNCSSLNTYFAHDKLHCRSCGNVETIQKMPKAVLKLLIGGILTIGGVIVIYSLI